jgi:hypothetical protein
MKVRVTKQFPWAPDGNHVRTVKVGEVMEGRGAEVAMQLASGELLTEQAPPKEPAKSPVKPPEPSKGR